MTLNGNLTGYQLSCQPLLPGIPFPLALNPGPTAVVVMLSALYPGVGYNCSIVARNGAGPSDSAYTNGTTPETGTSVYVVRTDYLMLYVTNLIPTLSPCVNQTLKGKWPCMMLFNCHHAALAALLLVICAHMEIILVLQAMESWEVPGNEASMLLVTSFQLALFLKFGSPDYMHSRNVEYSLPSVSFTIQ